MICSFGIQTNTVMAKAASTPKPTDKELKKHSISFKTNLHEAFKNIPAGLPAANFEYTLTLTGVKVLLLDINSTNVTNIKQSGKIFADTAKPFFIEVRALLNSPTGTGSLQLKDLIKDKDVFDKPQEFTFSNTGKGGLFLKNVKLP